MEITRPSCFVFRPFVIAALVFMFAALFGSTLRAQDQLIQPTAITSSTSGSDVFPASQLINGSGLSGTPTLANLGTHSTNDGTTLWATAANGPDYFVSNGGRLPVVLTCTLPQRSLVSELVYWGYSGNYNEAKSFTVEFSTDGVNFSGPANVTQPTVIGINGVRLAFPGGARPATHVRVTITDNHYGTGGVTNQGGDRVGLGEIRFAGHLPLLNTVVSNLDNASTTQTLSSDGQFAQAFETGPVPVQLGAITVRLANNSGTSRARVRLWSGAGNVPVTPVEDLGTTADFTATADTSYTLASPTRPTLAANTRYWVVVSADSGAGTFGWRTTSNAAFLTSQGATLPLARAKGTGGGPTWAVFNGTDYQLFSVADARLLVANTNDSGAGSLRQALADAAAIPGPDTITFDSTLSGQTIVLSTFTNDGDGNSALTVSSTGGVTLDASALPGGLTLTANGSGFRAFRVATGSSLSLRGLSLSGFTGQSTYYGGAISNGGTLTLTQCTLSGNSASNGGALRNDGTLTLTQCTLSGNSASNGGAISNLGTLTLKQCSLSGNSASFGGAIYNDGGLTLTNSIVAGNTAPSGRDIYNPGGTITATGVNLLSDLTFSGLSAGSHVIVGEPMLAPLGNYGGPTKTMPPLPGSPAIDAGDPSVVTANNLSTDQRGSGFPRVVDGDGNGSVIPDIGAAEAAPATNLSFEQPVLAAGGVTGDNPGWTDVFAGPADAFIEHIAGFAAQGNQHLGMNANAQVFRDLDATYAPNAVYRLRVAMGNRAGYTDGGNASTASLTDPASTATLSTVANASTIPSGTFAEMPVLLVDTALNPALVGKRIRVQLSAAGTGRSHFDNVRLDRVFLVTHTNDSGLGSLRQAVADAAANDGADTIAFAPALAGQAIALSSSLTITDAGGVTLDTTVAGGSVDVAVNAGTLSFGAGSVWSGSGRILLGATSGSADATVEVNGPNGFTLAAPITVRAGSSGVKKLRAANVGNGVSTNDNFFAGAITLLAPATVEQVTSLPTSEKVTFTGPVDIGAHLLTVAAADDVRFDGTVGRGDGVGTAQLEVVSGSCSLRGNAANPRLTATVSGSILILQKASAAALGSGLPAGTTALTVAGGATATVAGTGQNQIADSASVTVNGTLDLLENETLDALNGSGTVSAIYFTLTVGAGNGSGTFTGSLDDRISFTKIGTGTQTVAGSTKGTLLVSGGTLNVTGTFTIETSATVQSGAALAGIGSVNNLTLQSGSSFAPGDAQAAGSIGTLTASQSGANTTVWHPGATARFDLINTGNTSDRLAVTGTLTKGATGSGGFVFDFQGTGTASQTYTLATFATNSGFVVGDFTATNLPPGLRGFFTLGATSLTFTTYASTAVSNVNDSGPGSLRQAVLNAASAPGADTIVFASGFTGTVNLASAITLDSDVTLDASSIAGGVTISGNNATRLFTVNSGQSVAMKNLTLTGGRTTGSTANDVGGAIRNLGTLALTRCTMQGNAAVASEGGAIGNLGTLTLLQCTMTGNSCGSSGAGGAIHNSGSGTLALTHCTVSGNTGGTGAGGIFVGGTSITLTNCIVAANIAPAGSDLRGPTLTTYVGANIVQSVAGAGGVTGPAAMNVAPLLAPLGNYGGPTQTMALLPGSPARNAAVGSTATTDQRGFPIVGTPDLGAYEAGTFNTYDAWIWETLPATATTPQHASGIDFDGDGQTNGSEWITLTNPNASNSRFAATPVRNGANLEITIPTATGRTYTLLQSDTLVGGSWTAASGFSPQSGTGSNLTFQIPIAGPRKFYQVQVTLP